MKKVDYRKVLRELREYRSRLNRIITQFELLGPEEIHLLIPPESLIKRAEKITGYKTEDAQPEKEK